MRLSKLKQKQKDQKNEPSPLQIQGYRFLESAVDQALANQQLRYKISYSNPASIKLAQGHQKATKYGYKIPMKVSKQNRKQLILQKQSICGCCNLSANNQEISMCHHIQPSRLNDTEKYKLTEDVALFFAFIKSVVFFIIIHTLIQSAFNIISSDLAGQHCDKVATCQHVIWNKISISNKYQRKDLLFVVNILNLACIVVSIVYFGWGRRNFYKISQNIDRSSVDQGDFTLLISNIPCIEYPQNIDDPSQSLRRQQSSSRQRLKDFLQGIISEGIQKNDYTGQGNQLRRCITSTSLCYNLSELQILHNSKWNLIWSFESNFILFDFCGIKIPDLFGFKNKSTNQDIVNLTQQNTSLMNEQKPSPINIKRRLQTNYNRQADFGSIDPIKKIELNQIRKKVKFINESEIVIIKQLTRNKKLLFHNSNFSGNAFVSFQWEDFKQYIHYKFLQNPKDFVFQGNQLIIQDACDPTDVNWFNMKISDSVRINKIIFSYIVLFMLLLFSFMILFSVQILKRSYVKSEQGGIINTAKTQGLSLISSLIVLGANSLFDFVTWFLTDLQAHKTKTNSMFSHMIKSFFSKMFNTIMMYFMIAIILTRDYQQQKFMSAAGLVPQIYNFIVVSGLINLGWSFVNKDDLWMRLKRWYIYKYRLDNSDDVYTKFQISLNRQFELSQFNLVHKYSDYLVTLYTAMFYSYLVPIGVPILIVIFVIQYWIDKFNLFKRSSLKNHLHYNISIYVRKMFQSSLLIFAVGNILFSYYLEDYSVSVFNIISLAVTIVFTLCVWIAPQGVERKLFGQYEASDPISYSECTKNNVFKSTYWSQNPATFCIDEEQQNSRMFDSSKLTGGRKFRQKSYV